MYGGDLDLVMGVDITITTNC